MKKSVIVMGVAGCGKSSLGAMLAEGMGVTLVEGDDYHSPTSREKLLSLLRECRANGGKVIFDNNYRPRLWASKEETQQVYQQMLECTDIAFLTLDDEDALWGQQPVEDVIARTHNAGVKEVVVKRGADSCLVSIAGEGLVDVPAVKLPKEKVIDTTAAGDSCSAGYLAVRLTGGSAEDAVIQPTPLVGLDLDHIAGGDARAGNDQLAVGSMAVGGEIDRGAIFLRNPELDASGESRHCLCSYFVYGLPSQRLIPSVRVT